MRAKVIQQQEWVEMIQPAAAYAAAEFDAGAFAHPFRFYDIDYCANFPGFAHEILLFIHR
jgi:hypothetical protein